MSFLKFLLKDIKSDRLFNWFYILCASLGIIGLLLVESFRVGVEEKVSKNAKNFIASDLSISTRRAFSEKDIKSIEKYLKNNDFAYAQWIETYSLISKVQDKNLQSEVKAKLADLNFVQENFPFYGGVTLEEGTRGPGEWKSLHLEPQLWISRDLSWELDVKKGDQIKVGEAIFKVGGIILEDKFSSFRGFNLAPKVFISYNYLKQTDLIKFGSTATFSYVAKLPTGVEASEVKTQLLEELEDKSIKINGPKEASMQVSRSLNLLTDYLSLITLLTYLLSLVGLYYFTQHFLSKKLKTLSIYKSLGLTTSFLFRISFVQLLILTSIAVLFSSTFILSVLPIIENIFTKLVGESLFFKLNILSLLRIFALSLGGSLLALGPLFWGALQTPIATIFQDLPAELKRIKFYYFFPLLIYVIVLAVFLTHSFKVGGYFLMALATIVLLAAIFFKIFCILLDRFSNRFSFVTKQSARTLSRYFTSSFTIFICLLIGMTLTIFIFQLEGSLREEFVDRGSNTRPDIFFFDLQDTQVDQFKALSTTENWNITMLSPMIRGRLIKINDELTENRDEINENSNFTTREEENAQRMRNRGVNLSYREKLSTSETLVAGKYDSKTCDQSKGPCEVSLEQSYARRLGAKLGDRLLFDISGVPIEGVVTSFRTVKWTSFEPNFFILFQPGVLEEAPKIYLGSIKVKSLEEKRHIFSKMAEKFPSVSLLEVSEILRKIITIFELMAIAIKFISFLSLFVAIVVLIAVSFNHLELRKREMSLFNMLGVKESLIKKIYSREFIFLVALCFFLSLFFGVGLTLVIMKFVFATTAILNLGLVFPLMIGLSIFLYLIVKMRINQLVKSKSLF